MTKRKTLNYFARTLLVLSVILLTLGIFSFVKYSAVQSEMDDSGLRRDDFWDFRPKLTEEEQLEWDRMAAEANVYYILGMVGVWGGIASCGIAFLIYRKKEFDYRFDNALDKTFKWISFALILPLALLLMAIVRSNRTEFEVTWTEK